jgi:hypothetical protein
VGERLTSEPKRLTPADFLTDVPCELRRYTKPGAREAYFCRACGAFSRTAACRARALAKAQEKSR